VIESCCKNGHASLLNEILATKPEAGANLDFEENLPIHSLSQVLSLFVIFLLEYSQQAGGAEWNA